MLAQTHGRIDPIQDLTFSLKLLSTPDQWGLDQKTFFFALSSKNLKKAFFCILKLKKSQKSIFLHFKTQKISKKHFLAFIFIFFYFFGFLIFRILSFIMIFSKMILSKTKMSRLFAVVVCQMAEQTGWIHFRKPNWDDASQT